MHTFASHPIHLNRAFPETTCKLAKGLAHTDKAKIKRKIKVNIAQGHQVKPVNMRCCVISNWSNFKRKTATKQHGFFTCQQQRFFV
jgi:hypothetical protein